MLMSYQVFAKLCENMDFSLSFNVDLKVLFLVASYETLKRFVEGLNLQGVPDTTTCFLTSLDNLFPAIFREQQQQQIQMGDSSFVYSIQNGGNASKQ